MVDAKDPLDALRDAWCELEAPAPDAALDAPEPAVEWLREAWGALEAPALSGEVSARPAHHLFAGGPRRLMGLVAAAAVLALALPMVRHALDSGAPRVAMLEASPPRLTAVERGDGAIELSKGPVRLVFLMPDSPRTDPQGDSRGESSRR